MIMFVPKLCLTWKKGNKDYAIEIYMFFLWGGQNRIIKKEQETVDIRLYNV